MTTPSIEFNGVWKKFRRGEVHDSLRDLIPAVVARALGRKRNTESLGDREFWALQDVSFKVGSVRRLVLLVVMVRESLLYLRHSPMFCSQIVAGAR